MVVVVLSAGSCDLDDSRRHDDDDDACDDLSFAGINHCIFTAWIPKQKSRRGKALSVYRTGAEIFSMQKKKKNFAEMTVYMQPFDTEVATRMIVTVC